MAESAEDVRRMALGVLQSRLLDGRQLMDEFKAVLARDYSIRHTVAVAQAPANTAKNRYVNVLPYDHNRVLLRPCSQASAVAAANGLSSGSGRVGGSAPQPPPPSHPQGRPPPQGPGGPHPDYINASHVLHEDDQCGFSVSYIACQGPLTSTVADFWRMCMSEGVGAVVMLTNTMERGVTKCSPYYPAQPGERLVLRAGAGVGQGAGPGGPAGGARQAGSSSSQQQQQQRRGRQDGDAGASCGCVEPSPCCLEEVVAVSSRQLLQGDLTETSLMLLGPQLPAAPPALSPQQPYLHASASAPPPQHRTVAHLHYNAWPDHGTPADAAAIRSLCDLLRPVRSAGEAVVVHCSAGIGRTGTFCAIDILRRRLDCLAAAAEQRPGSVAQEAVHAALDLPELVHSLRRQRCGMVQTIEQYAFCYQAVYEELLEALEGGGRRVGGGGGGGGPRGAGGGGPGTPTRGLRR